MNQKYHHQPRFPVTTGSMVSVNAWVLCLCLAMGSMAGADSAEKAPADAHDAKILRRDERRSEVLERKSRRDHVQKENADAELDRASKDLLDTQIQQREDIRNMESINADLSASEEE